LVHAFLEQPLAERGWGPARKNGEFESARAMIVLLQISDAIGKAAFHEWNWPESAM
jgi:hypothetical protein